MKEKEPKEVIRARLLKILIECDEEWPTREEMSLMLGYATPHSIYDVFTPQEIGEIQTAALEEQRKTYAPRLKEVDRAMLLGAKKGNEKAAKLCYQRFERWAERQEVDINPNEVIAERAAKRLGKDEDA